MEELINVVRRMLEANLTKTEIADACSKYATQGNVFLAYHAAKILHDDYVNALTNKPT